MFSQLKECRKFISFFICPECSQSKYSKISHCFKICELVGGVVIEDGYSENRNLSSLSLGELVSVSYMQVVLCTNKKATMLLHVYKKKYILCQRMLFNLIKYAVLEITSTWASFS